MMKLSDRTAVVTGAGQGLGRAMAVRLAADGADVAIVDLNGDNAAAVASEIQAVGRRGLGLQADVTRIEAIREAVDRIVDEFGRIDVWVNNAGLGQSVVRLVDLSEEEWNRVIAVNLTGTFLCAKVVAPVMMRQESGRIINISSINGLAPAPLVGAYNAAKMAVIGLTKTLAYELAAYGITVNAVCPGPVYTDFNKAVMAQRAEINRIPVEEQVERVRKMIPLGRWGEPEDIAAMVAFLASDDARWATAEVYCITGGIAGVSGSVPRKE